jgi:hypothetical protein
LAGSPRPIHCRTLRYESALPPISYHSFRATGITTHLQNGGKLEMKRDGKIG